MGLVLLHAAIHNVCNWIQASRGRYYTWVALHTAIATTITCLIARVVFTSSDGFSIGIFYIHNTPIAEWDALSYVHALRYVLFWPIWQVALHNGPYILKAVIAMLPILVMVLLPWRREERAHPLRVVLLYLPCFLSIRACFVTVGMGYLFLMLFAQYRSRLLMILSALCVNLSSATVFMFLANYALQIKRRQVQLRPLLISILCILSVSLTISLCSKYSFFTEGEVRVIKQKPITVMPDNAIKRSTIVQSYHEGDTSRFIVYTFICILYLVTLYHSYRHYRDKSFFLYFIIFLPAFFVEGLGVLALLAPMAVFWLDVRKDPSLERL